MTSQPGQSSPQRARRPFEHWPAAYRTSAKSTMSSSEIARGFLLESKRAVSVGRGVVAWGAVYGIVWWVAGGQILMKYLSRIRCRRLLAC